MWVLKRYIGPVLGNNAFFILYTFLHHTHASLPHYRGPQWTRLRGALTTVDRSFGPWQLLDHLHHRIGSTHVLHHFFSSVPHYHAEEASRAIRPLLGRYYLRDDTPWPKALYREFCDDKYVAPLPGQSPDVLWFRKT
jgi:omega-6 fatty acid desaturase (delta-12 desaturase)